MLLMDRNFNPFAISIIQAHIINGNFTSCVTVRLLHFHLQPQYSEYELFHLNFTSLEVSHTNTECPIAHCKNMRGVGKRMVAFRLFEKVRY